MINLPHAEKDVYSWVSNGNYRNALLWIKYMVPLFEGNAEMHAKDL